MPSNGADRKCSDEVLKLWKGDRALAIDGLYKLCDV